MSLQAGELQSHSVWPSLEVTRTLVDRVRPSHCPIEKLAAGRPTATDFACCPAQTDRAILPSA